MNKKLFLQTFGRLLFRYTRTLLPKTIAWAEEQSNLVASLGRPLTESELVCARSLGVTAPTKIRISVVDSLPILI